MLLVHILKENSDSYLIIASHHFFQHFIMKCFNQIEKLKLYAEHSYSATQILQLNILPYLCYHTSTHPFHWFLTSKYTNIHITAPPPPSHIICVVETWKTSLGNRIESHVYVNKLEN